MGLLEIHLRQRREAGRALLMPYLTGAITGDWVDYLRAFVDAGADAIEIGLPFSDPTLDGATIQEASHVALSRGASVRAILAGLSGLELGVPLVASTYQNLVLHDGPEAFCGALRTAGVDGLIVADLPLEEADEVEQAAADAGVDLALLASPATPPPRLAAIARRSRGFVYAVSLMGTTGERAALSASATTLAGQLCESTDRPVLLGFGISTPDQAAQAIRTADGVVVGAAIMRRILDGASPADVGAYLAAMRQALDQEREPAS
ncbi:tryptophan synthase subunit alpha [Rugosimonospora africana]|uniref:Tryptophan synthase alpha chain n=1 Tax=Rugosimonospora africana TaxID=556532 RepID=A0A8J3R0A0_9ACTN|nr:tryptophan synthase subunit alpha [Rugosimonospora africana]GIH19193.1 tryptophan synthase alpha chain [Rugosimonospora africana]